MRWTASRAGRTAGTSRWRAANARAWQISPARCSELAAGWVAALKLVPWGDVIEATPQILRAAKKLLGTTRKGNAEAAAGALEGAGGEPAIPVALQLEHLRERVVMLEQERLTVAVGVLAVGCAGLLVWVLRP